MDGGLRDARALGPQDPTDPRLQELQQHMAAGQQRRARLQPLIDER